MYALYKKDVHRTQVVFDDFYRLIDIVENLYFNESDIDYLRSKKMYEEDSISNCDSS
ncbi:Nicotinate phosphoribosyltransferase [Brevibacillus laterosporus]|nr:Nicotinate phosphoribosyltransferase [Brevibacillus laterosporus]